MSLPVSHPEPSPAGEAASPQMVRVALPGGKPWATYALLGFTVLVYLGQMAGPYLFGVDIVTSLAVKYGPLIAKGQLWRLVTPIFLHGSVLHIGFNMYALYVIGPALERFLGRTRFLLLYFLAGVGGNVFSLWFTPEPSLGASTAIFGLLAAEGILVYTNAFLFPNARKTLSNLVTIAVVNFVIGLSPGIDNWGHLGGFIFGGAFAWFAGPRFGVEGLPPELRLRDKRLPAQVWRVALLLALLLGGLTLLWLFVQVV